MTAALQEKIKLNIDTEALITSYCTDTKVCEFKLFDISNNFHENLLGALITLILWLHLVDRNFTRVEKNVLFFILLW